MVVVAAEKILAAARLLRPTGVAQENNGQRTSFRPAVLADCCSAQRRATRAPTIFASLSSDAKGAVVIARKFECMETTQQHLLFVVDGQPIRGSK